MGQARVQVLHIPELDADGSFVHGFSTLAIGSVGLTNAPDPEVARAARREFARLLGIDPATLTTAGAVHGSDVARVNEPKDVVDGVDVLMTDRPGVALFATYADCYPIVLWDPRHRAVALAHAGWRGTKAGVARAAVDAMRREFGSDAAEIRAGIGPGICGSCYEVGDEVASGFEARFVTPSPGGRYLLDLAAANRDQLEAEGVRHIHRLDMCTLETEDLPSHRRTRDGRRFGAIVAVR